MHGVGIPSVHTAGPLPDGRQPHSIPLGIWQGRWARNHPSPSHFLEAGLSLMPYFEAVLKAPSGVYWDQHQLNPLSLAAGLWECRGGGFTAQHWPSNPRWTPRGLRGIIHHGAQLCVCANAVFPFLKDSDGVSWLEFLLRNSETALLYGSVCACGNLGWCVGHKLLDKLGIIQEQSL